MYTLNEPMKNSRKEPKIRVMTQRGTSVSFAYDEYSMVFESEYVKIFKRDGSHAPVAAFYRPDSVIVS